MKNQHLSLLLISLLACLLVYCKKENQEDLAGPQCEEISGVSFSATVFPILQNNCLVCHDQATASGGVKLHNYLNVEIYANNGRLLGAIKHSSGFEAMPVGQDKLPLCEIQKIETWINEGAQDN